MNQPILTNIVNHQKSTIMDQRYHEIDQQPTFFTINQPLTNVIDHWSPMKKLDIHYHSHASTPINSLSLSLPRGLRQLRASLVGCHRRLRCGTSANKGPANRGSLLCKMKIIRSGRFLTRNVGLFVVDLYLIMVVKTGWFIVDNDGCW